MIVLHNPTDSTIKDYPISDPKSKETLLWNIGPGETLEFPDHVGKYLLDVYSFLQKVMTEDQYREQKEEEEKIKTGKVYSQVRIVKTAEKAEPEVVVPPSPQPGFTNANMKPGREEQAVPPPPTPVTPEAFTCPEQTCKQVFKSERYMKLHYSLKHFEMPK